MTPPNGNGGNLTVRGFVDPFWKRTAATVCACFCHREECPGHRLTYKLMHQLVDRILEPNSSHRFFTVIPEGPVYEKFPDPVPRRVDDPVPRRRANTRTDSDGSPDTVLPAHADPVPHRRDDPLPVATAAPTLLTTTTLPINPAAVTRSSTVQVDATEAIACAMQAKRV